MTTHVSTIEVAIFAYNAEKNIQKILTSLLGQKGTGFKIRQILVYSDKSTDNTIQLAQAFGNPKIRVINAKERKGFASTAKRAMLAIKSEFLIMLNDDISIPDKHFVANIVKCFHRESNVGLVCSNIEPFPGKNFVEKAVISGFVAYKKTAMQLNSGNNKFTCDGKSMTVSKGFIDSLNLRVPDSNMGNVDLYLYVECMKLGFKYRFARNSLLYFKSPSTSSDFIRWQVRNYATHQMLLRNSPKLSQDEIYLPMGVFFINRLREFIRNPIGSTYIYILGLICSFKVLRQSRSFNPMWETVLSTK